MRNIIHNVPWTSRCTLHAVSCMAWAWCSLAALAVLLAILIVRLWVEAEMAGHDPYCYWDGGFTSRSFDVYGQYNYYRHCDFPGPGPVSSLSCWVGPVGLPHLSVQKVRMFGLYCTRCWDSEQTFWMRVPLEYVVDDSPTKVSRINTLTYVLVQQTSWSSRCLQVWSDRVLPRSTSWIPLHQISCHRKQIMNIVTTYAALTLTPYIVFERNWNLQYLF